MFLIPKVSATATTAIKAKATVTAKGTVSSSGLGINRNSYITASGNLFGPVVLTASHDISLYVMAFLTHLDDIITCLDFL